MNNYKKVGIQTVLAAGRSTLPFFSRQNHLHTKKKGLSVVTNADVRAERIIRSAIEKHFPDHSIVGEERGWKRKPSPYIWTIDPIDGTSNFIIGSPLFGVMVALVFQNQVIFGAIYLPYFGQLFYAEKGNGAFMDSKRIHVSKIRSLSESMITVGSIHKVRPARVMLRICSHLYPKVRNIRIFHSAAVSYAYVASGKIEASLSVKPATPWDHTAGALIIREAGGKATDSIGKPWSLKSHDIVSSNGLIHSSLLKQLKYLE